MPLMGQIQTEFAGDQADAETLRMEEQARKLEEIRSALDSAEAGTENPPELGSGAEGMHEAIEDIVQAMKNMKTEFSDSI
ncbi:MAG: hypothetical protein R2874_14260 [Desulfobacterales bacterium]